MARVCGPVAGVMVGAAVQSTRWLHDLSDGRLCARQQPVGCMIDGQRGMCVCMPAAGVMADTVVLEHTLVE